MPVRRRSAVFAFMSLGLCGLGAEACPAPAPAWLRTLLLMPTQQLALADAGGAWPLGPDPALHTQVANPQLFFNGSVDAHSGRYGSVQAWLPQAPGRSLGLAAGLGPLQDHVSETRSRVALGQRLRGEGSPSLGAALNLRDQLSPLALGWGASLDLGLAWTLAWQSLELGVALRELPLCGPADAWRRQGSVGLGRRWGPWHLALDLSQSDREPLSPHAGLERDLGQGWALQLGLAGPTWPGEAPSWGSGLRARHGQGWLQLATRQSFGIGASAAKASLGWDFRPHRAATGAGSVAEAGPAAPAAVPGSFDLKAYRSNGSLQLIWPEQPQAGAYEVLLSLMPGASMRLAPAGRVKTAQWQGSLGLPGVSYYFKVRVLAPDGAVQAESRVLTLDPKAAGP